MVDVGVNPTKVSQAINASFKKYVDRSEGVASRFVSEKFKTSTTGIQCKKHLYIL